MNNNKVDIKKTAVHTLGWDSLEPLTLKLKVGRRTLKRGTNLMTYTQMKGRYLILSRVPKTSLRLGGSRLDDGYDVTRGGSSNLINVQQHVFC